MSDASMAERDRASAPPDRIDEILALHGGDARAAIEALLVEAEALRASISYGYVRARIPLVGKISG